MYKAVVIIISFGNKDLINGCVGSIRIGESTDIKLVIVENDINTDYNLELGEDVDVIYPRQNIGYGPAFNIAWRKYNGQSDVFVISNSDILFGYNVISSLIAELKGEADVGVIAPQLLNVDKSLQVTKAPLPTKWGYEKPKQDDVYLSGALLVIKAELLEQLDGFNELFKFYFEDTDLCRRARYNGWSLKLATDQTITHIGGASSRMTSKRLLYEYQYFKSGALYMLLHHGANATKLYSIRFFISFLGRCILRLLKLNFREAKQLFKNAVGAAKLVVNGGKLDALITDRL